MGDIIPVDSQTNLLQSIGRFLLTSTYSKDGGVTSLTLKGHYPQGVLSGSSNSEQLSDITIIFSDPDVLTDMVLPTVSINDVEFQPDEVLSFGSDITEEKHTIAILIFGGGYRTNGELDDGLNKFKTRQLANDLKNIIENAFIDFFDFADSSNPVRTEEDIRIEEATLTNVTPIGETEEERYQFSLEFDAKIIKTIRDNL